MPGTCRLILILFAVYLLPQPLWASVPTWPPRWWAFCQQAVESRFPLAGRFWGRTPAPETPHPHTKAGAEPEEIQQSEREAGPTDGTPSQVDAATELPQEIPQEMPLQLAPASGEPGAEGGAAEDGKLELSADNSVDPDELAIHWLVEVERRVDRKIARLRIELLKPGMQSVRETIEHKLDAIRADLAASLSQCIDASELRGAPLREHLRTMTIGFEQRVDQLEQEWGASKQSEKETELTEEERRQARAAAIRTISEIALDPFLLLPNKPYMFDYGGPHSSIQWISFDDSVLEYLRTAAENRAVMFLRALRNSRVGPHGEAGIAKLEPHPKLVQWKVLARSVPETILGCLEDKKVHFVRVIFSRPTEGDIARRYNNLCP